MKKLLLGLLVVAVAAAACVWVYLYTKKNNSIVAPATVNLRADCSGISRVPLIKSEVTVTVTNLGPSPRSAITVKVMGFDKNGDYWTEKYATFEMTLGPGQEMSKTVKFPPKIRSCTCEILDAH
jgi:hypothetical protein